MNTFKILFLILRLSAAPVSEPEPTRCETICRTEDQDSCCYNDCVCRTDPDERVRERHCRAWKKLGCDKNSSVEPASAPVNCSNECEIEDACCWWRCTCDNERDPHLKSQACKNYRVTCLNMPEMTP